MTESTINLFTFLLYTAIILLVELIQCLYNQPHLLFLQQIILFVSILYLFFIFKFPRTGFFLLFVYECFETSSWVIIQNNINFQVIDSIDMAYLKDDHPDYLFYAFLAFLVILGFLHIPFPDISLTISDSYSYLVFFILFPSFLYFSITLYHSFYPFNDIFININELSPTAIKITKAFSTTPKILSTPQLKKNVILYQIESFEKGPIGVYNQKYPESMPFISHLARNATIFDNLESQPYTTWTAAGTFITQCSFPQIINDPSVFRNKLHSHITEWAKFPCLPTYLKMAGYHMYSYMVGTMKLMGLKQFLIDRGYKTHDRFNHGINHDVPMYSMVINKILPDLVKNKQPFALHLSNEDTHPFFYTDPVCIENNKKIFKGKGIPPIISAFNCMDQITYNFTQQTRKLGLNDNNTVFVIYGDHLCFGGKNGLYPERKLVNIFPFKSKNINHKPGTYYDLVPTILNQLQFTYEPSFPFGSDLFSDEIGIYPTEQDFRFIFNLRAKQTHKSNEIKCNSKEGFCT